MTSTCGFLGPFSMSGSSIPVSLVRCSETGAATLQSVKHPARSIPSLPILYSMMRICQGTCAVIDMDSDPSILSRLDLGLLEIFLGVIQKLLTNDGDVLPESAGIGQRAVDAASPLADAVSVAETGKKCAGFCVSCHSCFRPWLPARA